MSIKIMNEVWEHASVSQGTLLVALALADSADEKSRECWPSIRHLAERARLSERQVQRCLMELTDACMVVVSIGAGRGGSNLYHILAASKWRGDKMSGGDVDVTGGVTPMSPGGVTPMSPPSEPSYRTVNEPSSREGGQLALLSEEATEAKSDRFDEFWKAFPKKAGKPAALKAWQKAVRKTDPGKIIAAARVYAGSETVQRGFVKYPQGWLNEERFNDPDLQPPPPTAAPVQRWYPGGVVR